MKVLLVGEYNTGFENALRTNGYRIARCQHADVLRAQCDADLLMLDADQSSVAALQLLRTVRQVSSVAVLAFTSSRDALSAKRLLRCGADDFVMKPVRLGELLARIESATAHASQRESLPRRIDIRDISIDLRARTVWVEGRPVALTAKEFDVLDVLARNTGKAVPRERIMDSVWGEVSQARSRGLEVLLATIRAKTNRPDLINTIRGYGYRLA